MSFLTLLCTLLFLPAVTSCTKSTTTSNALNTAGRAAAQYAPPTTGEDKVVHWHTLIAELSAGNEGLRADLEKRARAIPNGYGDKLEESLLREEAKSYAQAEQGFTTAEEHLKAAYDFEKADSVDVALRHFQRAAELEPTKSEAFAGIGRCQARSSKFDEAVVAFHKACELAPDRPGWRLSLGDTLYAQGDRGGALAAYERALQIDPKFARALEGIAKVHWAKGEFDAAKSTLDQAIALGDKPDSAFVDRLNKDAAAKH